MYNKFFLKIFGYIKVENIFFRINYLYYTKFRYFLQTNLSKIVYSSDGKKINHDLLTYADNSRSENESLKR